MNTKEAFKIPLEGRKHLIPRDKLGNAEFTELEHVQKIFTEREIVVMVNKYLYGRLYSTEYHRKRAASQNELEAPIKAAFKELFPGVSWLNRTDQQQDQAIKRAIEERRGTRDVPKERSEEQSD